MSQTTNYGLHLSEDSSETFLSWRQKMNGAGDSNMKKIDEILSSKADSSIVVNSILLASSWVATPSISVLTLNEEEEPAPIEDEEGGNIPGEGISDIGSVAGAKRDHNEIFVAGLTADQNGIVFISPTATREQRDSARAAELFVKGQTDSLLYIGADGEVPTIDIPVSVVLFG